MTRSLSWICLTLTVFLNAAAGMLLKQAASSEAMAKAIIAGTSIACYGLAFVTYYAALRNFPVSVAYPVITSGTIMAIVLVAACLIGEPLSALKLAGALLVTTGGVMLMRS